MYQRRRDDPLRGLDHATRKRVRRAVRRGEAVRDPRDAPRAAAYADVVAAREKPIPFALPVLVGALVAVGGAAAMGLIGPVFVVPLAVAIVVRPLQARIVAKAKAAAELNRAYAVDTGVHVPDVPVPKPAWHGVTAGAFAVVVLAILAVHLGINTLDGGEDLSAPLPVAAEPSDAPVENPAWFAHAELRCREAAKAIDALPRRNPRTFRAHRFAIRERAAASIHEGAGLYPDVANGAVVHLNSALRHEQKALELERSGRPAGTEWKAAAYEGKVSASLLEALGVRGCAAAFA